MPKRKHTNRDTLSIKKDWQLLNDETTAFVDDIVNVWLYPNFNSRHPRDIFSGDECDSLETQFFFQRYRSDIIDECWTKSFQKFLNGVCITDNQDIQQKIAGFWRRQFTTAFDGLPEKIATEKELDLIRFEFDPTVITSQLTEAVNDKLKLLKQQKRQKTTNASSWINPFPESEIQDVPVEAYVIDSDTSTVAKNLPIFRSLPLRFGVKKTYSDKTNHSACKKWNSECWGCRKELASFLVNCEISLEQDTTELEEQEDSMCLDFMKMETSQDCRLFVLFFVRQFLVTSKETLSITIKTNKQFKHLQTQYVDHNNLFDLLINRCKGKTTMFVVLNLFANIADPIKHRINSNTGNRMCLSGWYGQFPVPALCEIIIRSEETIEVYSSRLKQDLKRFYITPNELLIEELAGQSKMFTVSWVGRFLALEEFENLKSIVLDITKNADIRWFTDYLISFPLHVINNWPNVNNYQLYLNRYNLFIPLYTTENVESTETKVARITNEISEKPLPQLTNKITEDDLHFGDCLVFDDPFTKEYVAQALDPIFRGYFFLFKDSKSKKIQIVGTTAKTEFKYTTELVSVDVGLGQFEVAYSGTSFFIVKTGIVQDRKTSKLNKVSTYTKWTNRNGGGESDFNVSLLRLWIEHCGKIDESPVHLGSQRIMPIGFFEPVEDILADRRFLNIWPGWGQNYLQIFKMIKSNPIQCATYLITLLRMIKYCLCIDSGRTSTSCTPAVLYGKEVNVPLDYRQYVLLINYLSHAVKWPDERVHAMIVLNSSQQGIGKGTLFDNILSKIYTSSFMKVERSEHLAGQFNDHLKNTLFLYLNENGITADSVDIVKNFLDQTDVIFTKKFCDSHSEKVNFRIVSSLNVKNANTLNSDLKTMLSATEVKTTRRFIFMFGNDDSVDTDVSPSPFTDNEKMFGILNDKKHASYFGVFLYFLQQLSTPAILSEFHTRSVRTAYHSRVQFGFQDDISNVITDVLDMAFRQWDKTTTLLFNPDRLPTTENCFYWLSLYGTVIEKEDTFIQKFRNNTFTVTDFEEIIRKLVNNNTIPEQLMIDSDVLFRGCLSVMDNHADWRSIKPKFDEKIIGNNLFKTETSLTTLKNNLLTNHPWFFNKITPDERLPFTIEDGKVRLTETGGKKWWHVDIFDDDVVNNDMESYTISKEPLDKVRPNNAGFVQTRGILDTRSMTRGKRKILFCSKTFGRPKKTDSISVNNLDEKILVDTIPKNSNEMFVPNLRTEAILKMIGGLAGQVIKKSDLNLPDMSPLTTLMKAKMTEDVDFDFYCNCE